MFGAASPRVDGPQLRQRAGVEEGGGLVDSSTQAVGVHPSDRLHHGVCGDALHDVFGLRYEVRGDSNVARTGG